MKNGSLSKIFSLAHRKCDETATYKCFYTLNFKDDQLRSEEAFGQLKFLNDESLSPQESITYTSKDDTQVVLLPLAGALDYCKGTQTTELIQSEQIKVFSIKKGLPYTLSNPFEKEWIHYLHIGFKLNTPPWEHPSSLQQINFSRTDELACLGLQQMENQPAGYIGIYQGRTKGIYTLKNAGNGVFIYVIKGAFEVHGRLLESQDGLSLWDTSEIDFEALSNNAIILLLEITLK